MKFGSRNNQWLALHTDIRKTDPLIGLAGRCPRSYVRDKNRKSISKQSFLTRPDERERRWAQGSLSRTLVVMSAASILRSGVNIWIKRYKCHSNN